MKTITLLIVLVAAINCTFKRYRACDERWASQVLYQNLQLDRRSEYTICNDYGFMDGRQGTFYVALANVFSNLGSTCGEQKECTPAYIQDLILLDWNYLQRVTEVEIEEYSVKSGDMPNIAEALKEWDIIGVAGQDDEHLYTFFITKVSGNLMTYIDERAEDTTVDLNILQGVFLFKKKNKLTFLS
jgi:hypothetical protein